MVWHMEKYREDEARTRAATFEKTYFLHFHGNNGYESTFSRETEAVHLVNWMHWHRVLEVMPPKPWFMRETFFTISDFSTYGGREIQRHKLHGRKVRHDSRRKGTFAARSERISIAVSCRSARICPIARLFLLRNLAEKLALGFVNVAFKFA